MAGRSRGQPAAALRADDARAATRSAEDLAAVVSESAGQRVEVVFGRSRTLPVQLRRARDGLRLRVHAFFASAPDDVVGALATWVTRGRRDPSALARLDAWIDDALDALPPRPARAALLVPEGRVHDLMALAAELRADGWIDDLAKEPGLTWGRTHGRARWSLQLGLFDPDAHTVRIHPVLDHETVPGWFVRSVLFHELLHAILPPRRAADGRWIKHGPEFRRRERAHVDHARAQAWLARHIGRLIDAAKRR